MSCVVICVSKQNITNYVLLLTSSKPGKLAVYNNDSTTFQFNFVTMLNFHSYSYTETQNIQGPVVQSIVSLTSLLRDQFVLFYDFITKCTDIFVAKMREAFAMQKLLTFFQQKILSLFR